LRAVLECQRDVEQRTQERAQQEGHAEQQHHTKATVAVGSDRELQADDSTQHHHERDDGMLHHDAGERHADHGTDHGGYHRQSQQEIGVAQDLVALGRQGAGAAVQDL
jgi:hypothetical protein